MSSANTPESPSPELWQPVAAGQKANVARNQWQSLVRTVPVYSEKGRYRVNISLGLPYAVRSPLRTGTLQFKATGIHFQGTQTQPHKGLEIFARVLWAIGCILPGISFVLRKQYPFLSIGSMAMLFVLPIYYGVHLLQDRRRGGAEIEIPWQSVYAAHVDDKLRWISLVYRNHTVPLRGVGAMHFLTLNNLEPAMVAGIADTISHYAPSAICTKAPLVEWTKERKVVYGCLGTVVLVLVLLVTISVIANLVFHRW